MNAASEPTPSTYERLTGRGPAAIAVLRACGPRAAAFVERHVRLPQGRRLDGTADGRVLRGELRDGDGQPLDDILVSLHAGAPGWHVRLHLHGNPWLVRQCEGLLEACGLKAATPAGSGLWAVADRIEAEACALLPSMLTLRGADWLMRQVALLRGLVAELCSGGVADARGVCAEVAGRVERVAWFTQALRVALVGPPNAGKSSLANALADRAVSVVDSTPGTTRDWVASPGEIDGLPVVWLDTAGLRATTDPLEAASVRRTQELLAGADAVVVVLDASEAGSAARGAFIEAYGELRPACVALNKCDLAGALESAGENWPAAWRERAVCTSATRGDGLEVLGRTLLAASGRNAALEEEPAAFTERQVRLLKEIGAGADCNVIRAKLLKLTSEGSDA